MAIEDIPRNLSSAKGLLPNDAETVKKLWKVYSDKKRRNTLRSFYYSMHIQARDLGISIPPKLKNLEQVIGWPAKAVDALASRSQFDGFVTDNEEADQYLKSVVQSNGLKRAYRKACISELTHSCSFLTITADNGFPVIRAYPATASAAIWDYVKNAIASGMVVSDYKATSNGDKVPSRVNVFTPENIITLICEGSRWTAYYMPHKMGRCLMEPLIYNATLEYPFGKSRISRAVMNITDNAMRASVRSEVSAEFFTTPQKFLLGVERDQLGDLSRWEAYVGNIFTVSKDEDGNIPQFGQLSQGNMQPHIDYMRSLAARFSGETGVPISSLGVISDNPSSAEAIYAAKEDIVIEAQNLNADNAEALRNIAIMALAIKDDSDYQTAAGAYSNIQARFKNPAMPSVVSQSDAMVKMISALPWLANSDIALEEFGFSDDQIQRLKSDRRKAQALERTNAMFGSRNQGELNDGNSEPTE